MLQNINDVEIVKTVQIVEQNIIRESRRWNKLYCVDFNTKLVKIFYFARAVYNMMVMRSRTRTSYSEH